MELGIVVVIELYKEFKTLGAIVSCVTPGLPGE